jgi:hypothetical protein
MSEELGPQENAGSRQETRHSRRSAGAGDPGVIHRHAPPICQPRTQMQDTRGMGVGRECRGAEPACQQECCLPSTPWPSAASGRLPCVTPARRGTTCAAIAAREARSMARTRGRWYWCEAIIKRLAQDLEDMAAELRPFIPEAPALVRPRHLAWHGEVPTADQPHIRDGMVRGATRAGRAPRRAVVGEIGDTVEAHRVAGLRQAHVPCASASPTP